MIKHGLHFSWLVSYFLTLAPSLYDANHSEIDYENTFWVNNWGYDGIYLAYMRQFSWCENGTLQGCLACTYLTLFVVFPFVHWRNYLKASAFCSFSLLLCCYENCPIPR
jgi:hypothetical protein